MTRVYWLRHGPTHQTVFTGWRDVPADLSDTALIARTAALLPHEAPVVSSDLIRARATADALCGPRQRLPDMAALREIHFGDWDGLPFPEVEARNPGIARAYWDTPGDIAPPGGESWNQTSARVEVAVQRLIAAHPGRPLIIVAHLGVILTQIARTTGHNASRAIALHIAPLSLTEIRIHATGRTLIRANHLA